VEFVPSEKKEEPQQLYWEDEQNTTEEEDLANLTTEEIEKRISMLEDIISGLDKVIKDEEPEKRFFIEGNDTLN
jgi:hypothetical protein